MNDSCRHNNNLEDYYNKYKRPFSKLQSSKVKYAFINHKPPTKWFELTLSSIILFFDRSLSHKIYLMCIMIGWECSNKDKLFLFIYKNGETPLLKLSYVRNIVF